MKYCFYLLILIISSTSCIFSKYGFPHKTKVSEDRLGNIYTISIDSNDLFGTNYLFEIQVLDENGEPGELVLVTDSIQVYIIEKFSNYFIKDLEFNYKNKKVEIDSISCLVLCQDSITILNTELWEYDQNYSRIGTHIYVESTIKEELKFKGEYFIIEDLVIYSKDKIFRFKNYFLWL